MLDLKTIRSNPELVRDSLRKRGKSETEPTLDELLQVDEKRRQLVFKAEQLKRERNEASEEVARLKRSGGNAAGAEALIARMRDVSGRIKELDAEVGVLDERMSALLLEIPNMPHPSVPVGTGAAGNVEVRRWGQPRASGFEPKAHWDVGVSLGVLDFERASKISGARFTVYRGKGCQLSRALTTFMLDLHIDEHGYTEVYPPFLVNEASMIGTGQLPKFAEDMFRCQGTDYYLVPTAEVPVTNLYRDEILDGGDLPIYHVAYTACFRAEAGASGKDTRGLIRQHQFDKVEMVKFVAPDTSYDELEKLVGNAEDVLQRLGLPYRVTAICTGDMGFSPAKQYDLEVWMPSYNRYVEISSCSNFEAFQARRAQIRFRPAPGERAEFVHTLNGSGLAVGRTLAAILENCQTADGRVVVPEALRPYMHGAEVIG